MLGWAPTRAARAIPLPQQAAECSFLKLFGVSNPLLKALTCGHVILPPFGLVFLLRSIPAFKEAL